MGHRTPLYQTHLDMGARIVEFGGWDMPVHYGSQIEEHRQVRRAAGIFDVSHMTIVDVRGDGARSYLRHLLANDVGRARQPGKALYSCMLNERGGIVDDLIVYCLNDRWFRLIVNASTRQKDLGWMRRWADGRQVEIDAPEELAMVAVQGPLARPMAAGVLDGPAGEVAASLARFSAAAVGSWLLARTGYTGEDGYEIVLPAGDAEALWRSLAHAGVRPCGLGARDTLRLEAGLNLYGADMDESTTPLEAGLGWTISWDPAGRDFIGRTALEAQLETGVEWKLAGLMLEGRSVPRSHMEVITGAAPGEITSGSFSPSLNAPIALARLPAQARDRCEVRIRGKAVPARVVVLPFMRSGKGAA